MTDHQLQTIILDEVRQLRIRFDVHSADTGERLSVLETHMESLVGNSQPGRLTIVENKVTELQHTHWLMRGVYLSVSALVSAITAYIYHVWK
jgi:hypothetical protein